MQVKTSVSAVGHRLILFRLLLKQLCSMWLCLLSGRGAVMVAVMESSEWRPGDEFVLLLGFWEWGDVRSRLKRH